jgi:hypothetical protein
MQLDWLSIILSAVIAIPLSIYANMLTPRVQKWLERRALRIQGKTLKRLQEEYERARELKDRPQRAIYLLATAVLVGIVFIFVAVFVGYLALAFASSEWIRVFYGTAFLAMLL